jgi:serine/threonine protein kinase
MKLLEQLTEALRDRYQVERELGQGGMAVVFLAQDLKHRRRVAIKLLRPELSAALGSERFLREIEIAAALQHPHILPLYDSGQAGGLLYYVMPYVEGESLRERLKREGALPLEDALRFAREVADALAYAHSQGVIHRDIKPGNILLVGGHAVAAAGDRWTDGAISTVWAACCTRC